MDDRAARQAPPMAGAPAWYQGPHAKLIAAGRPIAQVNEHYEKVPLQCYLTTHKQGWLWRPDTGVPLFVSHRRLSDAAHLYPATVPWGLDSGGFTEVALFGRHRTAPAEYVRAVVRYDREIGRMEWAAPQDWMCEPAMIRGGIIDGRKVPGTGLSVAEHQRRTVANFAELQSLWAWECELNDYFSECPFMPVLQGWEPEDYLRCADMYDAAGIRLEDYPLVGLGSVCRRNTPGELLRVLDGVIPRLTPWLALHGFGMKTTGLEVSGHLMTSADSASWSYTARRERIVLDGHTHSHCGNCLTYAKLWRSKMLAKVELARAS
jgi:hypothetical protein